MVFTATMTRVSDELGLTIPGVLSNGHRLSPFLVPSPHFRLLGTVVIPSISGTATAEVV